MIGRLRGEVIERAGSSLLIDVGGVGYRVTVPEAAPFRLGQRVDVHIHTHVREDALQLYGFAELMELAVFELLLTVQGVGPVKAMGMFQTPAADLVSLIVAGEPARLAKLPGVGKKTAERLVLDLREKMALLGPVQPARAGISSPPKKAHSPRAQDLISALVNLGFREAVAEDTAIKALERLGADAALEALLREALSVRRSAG